MSGATRTRRAGLEQGVAVAGGFLLGPVMSLPIATIALVTGYEREAALVGLGAVGSLAVSLLLTKGQAIGWGASTGGALEPKKPPAPVLALRRARAAAR